MTREEMIETLSNYCLNRSDCVSCPIKKITGVICNNVFSEMTDKELEERMALLEAEEKSGKPKDASHDEVAKQFMKYLTGTDNPEEAAKRIVFGTGNQQAKADAGKAPISLVPMDIVWAIAWIRKYGNEKYGDPDNWKTVEPERYRDALMRHLLHYISDPKSIDEESGYPHLWHAACNMAFLMSMDYGEMCCYDYTATRSEEVQI